MCMVGETSRSDNRGSGNKKLIRQRCIPVRAIGSESSDCCSFCPLLFISRRLFSHSLALEQLQSQHLVSPSSLPTQCGLSAVLFYSPLTSNMSYSRNDNDRNMPGKIELSSKNTLYSQCCWSFFVCVCLAGRSRVSSHRIIDGCSLLPVYHPTD